MTTALFGFLLVLLLHTLVVLGCEFELKSKQTVGHGQLMSFPSLWNEQTSAVITVDKKNGNVLLYPQMMAGSNFSVSGDRKYTIDWNNELFVMYNAAGKKQFVIRDYSSTFPVVEDDVFILNERKIVAYSGKDGKQLWSKPFCSRFVVSGVKDVHDMFVVTDDHAGPQDAIAVGFLLSGDGQCEVDGHGDQKIELLNKAPINKRADFHTPYIFYLNRRDGSFIKYYQLDPTPMDMVRKAIVKHDTSDGRELITLVGLVTRKSDVMINVISQYEGTRSEFSHKWTTKITAFHSHNYLWSNADTDYNNEHILFVADPTGKLEIAEAGAPPEIKKAQGLVLGMVNVEHGGIHRYHHIKYSGLITATYVSWLDKDRLLLGAIWDGEQPLKLQEGVVLRPLQRPVQGMIGFLAVYHTIHLKFLWVQEVAPEMAFPGHHIGHWENPKTPGRYSITTSPVFWDNAPSRHIDNDVRHNVKMIGLPQEDEIALITYEFDGSSCAGRHTFTSADEVAFKTSSELGDGGSLGSLFALVAVAFLIACVIGIVVYGVKNTDCTKLPFGGEKSPRIYKPAGGPETDDDLFDDDEWAEQNNPQEVL